MSVTVIKLEEVANVGFILSDIREALSARTKAKLAYDDDSSDATIGELLEDAIAGLQDVESRLKKVGETGELVIR